jgi:hypothetical protein
MQLKLTFLSLDVSVDYVNEDGVALVHSDQRVGVGEADL